MTLPKITPSNVSSLDCALRFKTLYIDRRWPRRDATNPATEFGTAFHEVMRHIFDPRQPNIPNMEPLDAWVRAAFLARRFPDINYQEAEMARCTHMIRGYVAADSDAEATIDIERQAEFPITWKGQPLFLLCAKFDRVIVRPDNPHRLVIRDYKTTMRRLNMEAAFITLWAAKLLYTGYTQYALELDWIDGITGAVERDVVEGSQLKGMHQVVMEKAVRVLTATEWPAQAGEVCQYCPHKDTCQPQNAAYDGERGVFDE